jgi:hypothetical protein
VDEPRCAGVASNDTIYRQMWGPTEFRSTGSLRNWTRAADLGGGGGVDAVHAGGEADDGDAAGTDWGGDCSNSVFHVRLA